MNLDLGAKLHSLKFSLGLILDNVGPKLDNVRFY